MSVIIQQQLRAILTTLLSDIQGGTEDEQLPNEPIYLGRIGGTAENISRRIKQVQILLREWTAILTGPDPVLRAAETLLFQGFTVGELTPSEILNEGSRTQTALELKIDLIRAQNPPPVQDLPPVRSAITLPPVRLPDFDGADSNWPTFWAAFRDSVHENPGINGAQKLTYLVGCLKGMARPLIEGFALTDANYPIVIDMLKGRFGDDAKRADRLRSELFHLPVPTGHPTSLRGFSESIERICRQLEALGTNVVDNSFLTTAITEKLPREVKAQLVDKELEGGRAWTSKEWRDKLIHVIRVKEAVRTPGDPAPSAPSHHNKPNLKPPEFTRRVFPVIGTQEGEMEKGEMERGEIEKSEMRKCSLCLYGGHKPSRCPTYKNVGERKARLAEQGRCTRCTREGHVEMTCPSTAACFRCSELHHILVCPKPFTAFTVNPKGSNAIPLGQRNMVNRETGQWRPGPKGESKMAIPIVNPFPSESDTQIVSAVSGHPGDSDPNNSSAAYLMIRTVDAYNHKDPTHPISVPVFFDPGAQPSFITSRLVSQINPGWLGNEQISVGGFQGNNKPLTHSFSSPRFKVCLQREDGGWEEVELNQTEKIVPPVEYLREIKWNPPHARGILTACQEPHILLGVGLFWKFFRRQTEVLPGLFKIDTVFGPMFGGKVETETTKLRPPRPDVQIFGAVVPGDRPEKLVQNLWSLESIGIMDSPGENEDDLAIDQFNRTVSFRNGRYEVGWPWRPGNRDCLSNNFSLAYSRLSSLTVKFRDNPEFRDRYGKAIDELMERGIIEPATRTGANEYFLPHHAVVTPKKLRVVHDASAHEKGKCSLNDLLLIGPNLVPELAGVLMRFRTTSLPVLGDLEKAFLAVGLREADREFAKFLWVKDPSRPLGSDNLIVVRFTRIAFGVNSSPFLLASVLRHHLMSLGDPLGMSRNFYVDNLLLCNETVAEARTAVQCARDVMAQAGMRLREFTASEPAVLEDLPAEDVLVGDVQKVLGISWDRPADSLTFPFPLITTHPMTRRGVLSSIASLFDPLGICSPCVVRQKIFFQSLWDNKRGWDEPLGESLQTQWKKLGEEWEGATLTFPRPTLCRGASVQLHVFSDAGPDAYATVAYLRAEWDHRVSTSLLFAKSRIRPKKMKEDGLTIPRLELLGLLIAVRAKKFITANFDHEFESVYFWSDSQIALSWIAGGGPHPTFVVNRLTEIRGEREAQFRYVRSADNPADWGARGASPQELMDSELWKRGPSWLCEPEGTWPKEYRDIVLPPEESIEMKEVNMAVMPILEGQTDNYPLLNPRLFSSWGRLLTNTSAVLSFISKKLNGSQRAKEKFPFIGELVGKELVSATVKQWARYWILKREQTELGDISGTFKDKDGILRLRTRLVHSQQPIDFKFPIVLPRDSWNTRLLILAAHQNSAHAGVDYTLALFLREYWCPRARRLVKSILRDCGICKRDRGIKFALPPMPPLPSSRVNPSPPFSHVGLDYLGPTLFRGDEGPPKKAWILLFTCFSSRAIHLELVDSLSTNSFLAGFRRFVARRGIPKRIWSDNGTQLVLGRQLLMTYYTLPIEWTLIPPHSPWVGGVYERMVGLVKTAFRRSLGRSVPSWEQLHTLMCEVEAILNNRPISFVSDEQNGPLPLRPVDFLAPSAQNILLEPDEPEQPYNPSPPEKLAHLWFVTNESLRRFWDLWSREYLLILRGRTQDTHKGPRSFAPQPPKVGDIVLVENEDQPRNIWPLGRIVSLHPESPDKARTAKVLMGKDRQLERSINQLVPLEATGNWDEVGTQQGPSAEITHRRSNRGKTKEPQGPPTRPIKWAPYHPLHPPEKRESTTQRRINWAPRHPLVMTILSILFLICGANGAPRALTCDPKGIWVFLNPQAEGALVCCEGICSSRSSKTPYLLPLPPDILVSGFECHTSYSLAGERVSSQVQCEPTDGCQLIDCYICWDRVLNPQCSPFIAALALGILFGGICVMAGITILCSFIAYRIARHYYYNGQCPWCLRRRGRELAVAWRRGPQIQEVNSDDEDEVFIHHPPELPGLSQPSVQGRFETGNPSPSIQGSEKENTRRRGLTRLGYALGPAFFCILFLSLPLPAQEGLQGISITANTEECTVEHGHSECHFNNITALSLLPAGQEVELIWRTPHSIPMGKITMVMKELDLECIPESHGWTRSFRINITSILRCHAAGSCGREFCYSLSPSQHVPELSESEEYPGLNFCREAEGFIKRGCFFSAYGCLFYRLSAVPLSPHPYEVITCPTWQFRLKVGVTLEREGLSFGTDLTLIPGLTSTIPQANLTVLFTPAGLPSLPILESDFVLGNKGAALIRGFSRHLKCDTKQAASRLNCSLSLETCQICHTHMESGVANCQCKTNDIEAFLTDSQKRLPLSIGQLQLKHHEDKILASVPYSPVNLLLKMTGTRLTVRHLRTTCTVSPGPLRGCYRCRTGGRLNYTCHSSQGEAYASILCKDGTNWVTRCSPTGYHSSVVLTWAQPEVNTICRADCLGGETVFQIVGTLIYLGRRGGDLSLVSSATGKKGNYTNGITFPQIKFALIGSLGSVPQVFLALLAGLICLILFLVAVRYCPLSILLAPCLPPGMLAIATGAEIATQRRPQIPERVRMDPENPPRARRGGPQSRSRTM